MPRSFEGIRIRWILSPEGCVKLNCDGALTSSSRTAACGGILPDHCGRMIFGFAAFLGSCLVVWVELCGILKGVQLAWNRGFCRIFIDFDSLVAINLLVGDIDPVHPCVALIQQIKAFTHQGRDFIWTHTLREANKVADALAKFGLHHTNKEYIFEIVPSFLSLG